MADKRELVTVFEDTMDLCKEDKDLKKSIADSIAKTIITDAPELPDRLTKTPRVVVARYRTFEAAVNLCQKYPDDKVAVLNFASATNPGGGVTRGSSAQEESLCRCSTLYPVLTVSRMWRDFYQYHRAQHNQRYTDRCVYSPGIVIVKTDTSLPKRLDKKDWQTVDVITCAAPNLRLLSNQDQSQPQQPPVDDKELLEIHKRRARNILGLAAANKVDHLVLGAFGCGAFQNNPEIVAQAYNEVINELGCYFSTLYFAVYCTSRNTTNYDTFKRILR